MAAPATDAKGLLKEFSTAPWEQKEQMNQFIKRALSANDFPLKKAFTTLVDLDVTNDQMGFKRRLYCFELIANSNKDKQLAELLLDNLEKCPLALQTAITRILKETNDPIWHPKALKLLNHKNPGLRRLGKEICTTIGGKTMFEFLAKGLRSKSFPPKPEVLETLVSISGHYALPVLRDVYKGAPKADRINILRMASHPQYMARAKTDSSTFMVDCCADKDPHIVRAAIRGLANVGSKEQVPLLIELSERPDVTFLEDILHTVGTLAGDDNADVIRLLTKAIRGGRPNLQLAAIEGLYKIGTNEVLSPLSICLKDENLQVRQRGADAFVRLAKERKVEVGRLLIFLMREKDAQVRRIAVEIIDSIGREVEGLWQNLISSLTDTDWWVRERVTDVLVKIGGEHITKHVLALLSHEREIVRRYAIEVLVRIKNPQTCNHLLHAAQNDTDWWVRERAIEALGEIGDATMGPKMIAFLDNEDLRWVTVKALGKIKCKESIPNLLGFLLEGETAFRLDVLEALEAIEDSAMIESINQLQYDVDKDVRLKAIAILNRYNVQTDGEQQYFKKATNLSTLDRLLLQTKKRGGTDLFLHSGTKPYIRYLSDVIPVSEQIITSEQLQSFLSPIMPEDKVEEVESRGDTDFSYEIPGEKARFRANIYRQRNGISAVFRVINDTITPIESLGFSQHVVNLTRHHQGMILVTGPAGSGKTTTLMAMVDYINRTRNGHIITLEDPVEYIIPNKECLVNQREVGASTETFGTGLKAALREDPDIVMIGEMRDIETFQIAITAAETGHLVLGTLHTVGAAQTVDRLIDVFPHEQQGQIRSMISESLKGVVTQQLVKKTNGEGRMLVTEVMIMNDAISNMIRKEKTYQIPTVLSTGLDQGMHLMDSQLRTLVENKEIAYEEALLKAVNKKEFESYFNPEEGEGKQAANNKQALPSDDERGSNGKN